MNGHEFVISLIYLLVLAPLIESSVGISAEKSFVSSFYSIRNSWKKMQPLLVDSLPLTKENA